MNNKSKFRFAILFFGVLSAFISTSCSGDNNGSLPDDPSQGGGALPVKQVSLSRKTAYGNDWIYYSLEKGKELANKIGYPVLIKASAGGGGRGMRKCFKEEDFENAYLTAKAEAKACFGDDDMYMEKLILNQQPCANTTEHGSM